MPNASAAKKRMNTKFLVHKMNEKILPTILMVLDFFAAVPYGVKGDLKMFVYWVAAGVLTLSVTWL